MHHIKTLRQDMPHLMCAKAKMMVRCCMSFGLCKGQQVFIGRGMGGGGASSIKHKVISMIKYWLCSIREREMFYLTTHSTHFIYGYVVSDIWLRTILIVRKETRCRHIGYCYRLTARAILYAPSHRQDSTYHDLCYTSRGALAGTRNSSMGPPTQSIRRPIAPWANALPLSYVPLLVFNNVITIY